MRKLSLGGCVLIFTLVLVNCHPGEEDNPVPGLISISPVSKVSHMPTFTLTAVGNNFVSGSKIVFDGIEKTTTFVSSTELSCQIDPDDILISTVSGQNGDGLCRVLDETVPVLVRNPSPGGGDSGSLNFIIYSNPTFHTPQSISNDPGEAALPDIAVDSSGNINVVWMDKTPGYWDIYFRHTVYGVFSWDPIRDISDLPYDANAPAIALDSSGNINVVWDNDTASFDNRIRFSRSTNNGSNWSNPVFITLASEDSITPDIAVDSAGNLNVVWTDWRTGTYDSEIYFSRSTDNGTEWSTPVNISWTIGGTWTPSIAVDSGGNLFVVWWDLTDAHEDICFSRSTNNGVSWSPYVNLSNTPIGESTHPVVAVDSAGNVNVVWDDEFPDPDELVYFTSSTNMGTIWTSPLGISNAFAFRPDIAIDSAGNINVVWVGYFSGNNALGFSRSTNGGTSWSTAMNISNIADCCNYTAIALDGAGNINIVWSSNDVIYYTYSE